jgi:hypothetical protein
VNPCPSLFERLPGTIDKLGSEAPIALSIGRRVSVLVLPNDLPEERMVDVYPELASHKL